MQGKACERFNEIQQELSQLSTKFSNNLLDATKAFKKLLKDPAEVSCCSLVPSSALQEEIGHHVEPVGRGPCNGRFEAVHPQTILRSQRLREAETALKYPLLGRIAYSAPHYARPLLSALIWCSPLCLLKAVSSWAASMVLITPNPI